MERIKFSVDDIEKIINRIGSSGKIQPVHSRISFRLSENELEKLIGKDVIYSPEKENTREKISTTLPEYRSSYIDYLELYKMLVIATVIAGIVIPVFVDINSLLAKFFKWLYELNGTFLYISYASVLIHIGNLILHLLRKIVLRNRSDALLGIHILSYYFTLIPLWIVANDIFLAPIFEHTKVEFTSLLNIFNITGGNFLYFMFSIMAIFFIPLYILLNIMLIVSLKDILIKYIYLLKF